MKKKRGPFVISGTKKVYENPWIRVREDKVIWPDGKQGVFGVVEMQGGVQVVALDREGHCYLTKEYHYGVGKKTIEVVAGGIEKGETPMQAAKRELREETGLVSRHWKFLGTFYPLSTIMYSKQHIFIAEGAEKLRDQSEEDKRNLRVLRVPFERAIQMAHRHTIDIAPSMVALLRAHDYLKLKKKSS